MTSTGLCGLSQRQLDSMLTTILDSMKMDVVREYSNALYRQGRARDTGTFSREEEDMLAMCDAYKIVLVKAITKVIEANNKKLQEDFQAILKAH